MDSVVQEPFSHRWAEHNHVTNFDLYRNALDFCVQKTRQNLNSFTEKFPFSCGVNHVYRSVENVNWTSSFWSGMVWLCYELTGDDRFKEAGLKHVESFRDRFDHDYHA